MTIQTVAIIGAGQMGRGIAETCAVHGKSVVLVDQNQDSLATAKTVIAENLARDVKKDRLSAKQSKKIQQAIVFTAKLEDIVPADLLIEAVNENESSKKSVLRACQEHLRDDALMASNTSSISITRLAAVSKKPDQFIGLHFMNPVPKMQLVEMIRGLQTSDTTFEVTQDFILGLGKTIALSEDFPAFIVNRILIPMINEAILTLYEGVGNVENIDKAMKLGAKHPMGPLELADYIGLDTVLAILNTLHEGLADQKYRPCPLLNRYVEAGWLGRKVGRGFYDYSSNPPKPTR